MIGEEMSEINSQMQYNQPALTFFSGPLPASPESCSNMASWSTPSAGKLLVEKEERESNEVGAREVSMWVSQAQVWES